MKSSKLITNVRRLFGLGRILTIICAVIAPLIVFIPTAPDDTTDLGEVFFKSSAPVVKNTADGAKRLVEVETLRGSLALQLVTPAELSLSRRVWLVPICLHIVLSFLVCHWMWRLCRNVENREIFTAGNLQLVRRMGWLLIADALLAFMVKVWATNHVADYVSGNLSFRGLEVVKPGVTDLLLDGMPSSAEFAFNQIIIGLLVLCLTEVFRLGVKLKEETDLTV